MSALGFELILVNQKNNIPEYWSNPASFEVVQCFYVPRTVHPVFEKQWSVWGNKNLIGKHNVEAKSAPTEIAEALLLLRSMNSLKRVSC